MSRILRALAATVLVVAAAPAQGEPLSWGPGQLPQLRVAALEQDEIGWLWLGGPEGLYRFDGMRFESRPLLGGRKELPTHVRSLCDGAGGLWIGTEQGLWLRYQGVDRHMGRLVNAIATEPINVLLDDAENNMWAATPGALFHWERGFGEVRSHGQAIAGVQALARGGKGMWIATVDRLLRWRGEGAGDPEPVEGLPGKLAVDGSGALWIGRPDGLWRRSEGAPPVLIDPRPVLALRGPRPWVVFPDGVYRLDGPAPERVLAQPGMRLIAADRTIWALGDRLYLWPQPDGALPPMTRITLASVAGKLANPEGPPMAATEGRGFEVDYTALGSALPAAVEFRYRLEGHDDDWILAGTRRHVGYGGLSPGDYRFHVAAREPGGPWGYQTALSFTLAPRFWQRTWFKVSGAFALALMLASVVLMDRRRRRAREQRRELAVEKRVEAEVTAARETERLAAYGQMVAGVAHEVRQPLFAITTVSYVLGQKLEGREDLAPQVALLDREVTRMAAMMDDLLDFARPAQLLTAPTDVAGLLKETLEIVRAEAAGGAELSASAAELPLVTMDRARLQQVLVNLVQNARRHAQGAKQVQLNASLEGERLRIDVRDDGAAIPPERLARLFEPFFTTGKGTGLGLAIAKRIVELHGGTLTVASDAGGTCFTLSMPVAG